MTTTFINILELEACQLLVKNFDQQLLQQLKNQQFEIQNLLNDYNGDFVDRIENIKKSGILRNKLHFEHQENKDRYTTALDAVYKQILLAFNDDVINEIGNCTISIFKKKIYFCKKSRKKHLRRTSPSIQSKIQ